MLILASIITKAINLGRSIVLKPPANPSIICNELFCLVGGWAITSYLILGLWLTESEMRLQTSFFMQDLTRKER